MTQAKLIILAALVASIVLLLRRREPFAMAAVVASALEALLVFGVLRLHLSGVNLLLILGITLAVGAIGAWMRTSDKVAVTAATVAATIGLIQVLGSVG